MNAPTPTNQETLSIPSTSVEASKPEEVLPDRVCINPDSPYFFKRFRKIGVKFNDRVTFDVEEYCISEGWILKQMRNPRGHIIHERGKARTIKLMGKVEPYWR